MFLYTEFLKYFEFATFFLALVTNQYYNVNYTGLNVYLLFIKAYIKFY